MDRIKDINHVWLFFTDHCNLGCGYCFYKYRGQKHVMTLKTFRNILNYIQPAVPVEFIFSGGEPLMEAERLKEMITIIQKEKLNRYISVQTNATLLDESFMKFSLQHEINLQFGIDGNETTTQHNRPGINGVCYKDIVRGVNLAVQAKGPTTTTMVVHPSRVSELLDNVKHLAKMGLRSIEVHPAFLEAWDEESSAIFFDQYRQASVWELKEGRLGLIGRGYSAPSKGTWDFLSVPNGKILANWVFLSFPEEIREHLYLIDFGHSSSGKFLPQAEPYFKALEAHLAQNPNCSYRSISNFNALYAARIPQGHEFKGRIKHYVDLCERIEALDHKIMERVTGYSRKI